MYLVLLLKITYGVTLMCLVLPSDIIVNRPGVLSVNSLLRQEVDLHVTMILSLCILSRMFQTAKNDPL